MVSTGAVTVAIVNHNGEAYLGQTLDAVAALGAAVSEVLLVDSGSTDGGMALVRARHPRVRIRELGANLGPGAARNTALREAACDRVLLLDNDVRPEPGCIEGLQHALDAHPAAVMAMPTIRYGDKPGTVQFAGADAHFLGTMAVRDADIPIESLDVTTRVVGSAVTACALVDRTRWNAGEWFDASMFIYQEDHELGLRASLMGFDLLAVPSVRCLHGSGTVGLSVRQTGRFTPMRIRCTIRNRWIVLAKLYQVRTLLRFAPALLCFEVLQVAGTVRRGWLHHWLWSVGSMVARAPGLLVQRMAFQRRRRRPDIDALIGGPFPFNTNLRSSGLEALARRWLNTVAALNWRLTGRRPAP